MLGEHRSTVVEPGIALDGSERLLVKTEAIVVVDLIKATAASNLFGWFSVGRCLVAELREIIEKVSEGHGVQCKKGMGDGFLLTYGDDNDGALAASKAARDCVSLLNEVRVRNSHVAREKRLGIRIALHFGEVEVQDNDRDGPNVSFAFRLEGLDRNSFVNAICDSESSELPLRDYILCSEQVAGILHERGDAPDLKKLGLFQLKGFAGWYEVYLLLGLSNRES